MEEILASIRRIISEDDAPAETAQVAAAEPAPEPAPAYESEPEPVDVSPAMMDETPSVQEDDVLELTDRYQEPVAAETIGDLDVTPSAPEPAWAPEPEPFPVAAPAAAPSGDGLIGAAAAGAAASAFAGLTAAVRKPAEPDLPAGAGTSLEALVGSLLRPMLKEWLDANLPAIVEAQVRKEVERIARNAG